LTPIAEPLEVDPGLFDDIIQKATVPVLVDFWAVVRSLPHRSSGSCANCRRNAGRAIAINVDTERYPDLASRFNVRGIPELCCLLSWQTSYAASRGCGSRAHGKLAEVRCANIGSLIVRITLMVAQT
jgi:hypothetical protein